MRGSTPLLPTLMDPEKEKTYHLECAGHFQMMNAIDKADKHIMAANLAIAMKTNNATEPYKLFCQKFKLRTATGK